MFFIRLVMERIYKKLIKGTKDYFKKTGFSRAVVGVSGGIDSALSLMLVADAIGNKNITALLMPEKGLSKIEDVKDSIELCKSLKVNYKIIEINSILNNFKMKQNKNSLINLKPRIRMLLLYNYASTNNALVIGTSNKTELKLGYFTKYGDGACDIEVIGDLYKTEVWKLAKYLKIPENIINKTPSAGLFKGQSDEAEIGASYTEIDGMLIGKGKINNKIKKLIEKNKHKTERIPIIQVH